jgi:predicted TPR repeat methyltransferase
MTKTITRDDVLRYIYDETSLEENLAIQKQLIVNSGLMNFYREVCDTATKVKDFQLEPSESSMNRILDYSDTLRFESIS